MESSSLSLCWKAGRWRGAGASRAKFGWLVLPSGRLLCLGRWRLRVWPPSYSGTSFWLSFYLDPLDRADDVWRLAEKDCFIMSINLFGPEGVPDFLSVPLMPVVTFSLFSWLAEFWLLANWLPVRF